MSSGRTTAAWHPTTSALGSLPSRRVGATASPTTPATSRPWSTTSGCGASPSSSTTSAARSGYALDHSERVSRLLILNTFCWSLRGPFALAPGPVAALLRGPVGRLFITQFNTELRLLIPQVYGDRRKLTPAIYRQYLAPLATPEDRHGLFAFAEQVFSESDWCEELWERRGALAGIPAAIVWGMRDPLFGQRFLARWREALPGAEVVTLPGAGHFVQEEAPTEVTQALRRLLATVPA